MVRSRTLVSPQQRRRYRGRAGALGPVAAGVGRAVARSLFNSTKSRIEGSIRRRVGKRKRAAPSGYPRARMAGNFRGPFKAPKKKVASKFSKFGVVRTTETGGVTTSTDCSYVGHSFATLQITEIVCQVLVRKLFEKVGITVVSMTDRIQGNLPGVWAVTGGTVIIQFRTTLGEQIQEYTQTVVADQTFAEFATVMASSFFYSINPADDVFELFNMFYVDGPGSSTVHRSVSIDLSQMKIEFDCDSHITLQNRTNANTGAADESNALDVANNPVEGRVYGGRGNGPVIRYADNVTAGVGILIANPTFGTIALDCNQTGIPDDMKANIIRPPSMSALTYVKSSAKVRLGPGVLKKGHLKWATTMRVNEFILKYRSAFNNSAVENVRVSPGTFGVYAFEKMCNTRDGSEPITAIGYELNQTYRAMCHSSKKGIATQHVILN